MGCSTTEDNCVAENTKVSQMNIRRVKTVNYSSIPKDNTNKSNKNLKVAKSAGTTKKKKVESLDENSSAEAGEVSHAAKTIEQPKPSPPSKNSHKYEVNKKSEEVEIKEMDGRNETLKNLMIEIKERVEKRDEETSPRDVLLALGYNLQLDYQDEGNQELLTTVRQLVIPLNSAEKLAKRCADEEVTTVARGSSGL
eukprot:TRINITY_DN2358_c0_g1_i16.p1 TRINITY_DN2358_c0_g1~~TRINITY_DN2358_c0_g1_i16.p1  ORF type:complete len:196 (+),score=47.17 TRINITY_DN2358_c0_g1_i16:111-698(+)